METTLRRVLRFCSCLATAPPLIDVAHHNISPVLPKKLVLELEFRMCGTKLINRFPCL